VNSSAPLAGARVANWGPAKSAKLHDSAERSQKDLMRAS
jgi:hypothetical protein